MKTSQYNMAATYQVRAVCLPAQDQTFQNSSIDWELLVTDAPERGRITLLWRCGTGKWLMSQ